MVQITIDGIAVSVEPGVTILEAARRAGIEIPNMCYRKELGPDGACGVCVVEVKGLPRLVRACATRIAEGMEISTVGERALAARRLALELILGDHEGDCLGPCKLKCPAHTDCQKYIKEIAQGRYADAVATVFETFPLPASIGRVCPHPCEQACRRRLVESPLSIAHLKAFAADRVRADGSARPVVCAPATGRKVSVVGGGPAGLTAAYQLARRGHAVTVYDQMPEMGGMLRYGIPAYRLPKDVLAAETSAIAALGVKFVNNFKIGRDATIQSLRASSDAVLVANGAWRSTSMRVPGEDLAGVWGGIDLLRAVACGERPVLGERVAVVGGGNTAMDACRTAVRLGAREVYVVYRRTRGEMPAEEIEIREAEEEGVRCAFLRAPEEIVGEGGRVSALKLQVMELGEPDERGRRRPLPVEGAFELLPVDCVIAAIGQRNDPDGFGDLPQTARGTIVSDESTFATALDGVFACGDSVNAGAGIAIGAIAQANGAAKAIDAFLRGVVCRPLSPVLSERTPGEKDYADVPRCARAEMPHRAADVRRNDFNEVNLALSEEVARAEAKRCLECGCHDYGECKLIRYANLCGADCKRLSGEKHAPGKERRLVAIERDQGKCMLCTLCVRTCENEAKKGILGLVGRGFSAVVKPEFRDAATVAGCAACHLCVDVCPTGALRLLEVPGAETCGGKGDKAE